MAKWDAFFREKKWKNMKKSDWIVLALLLCINSVRATT